MPKTLVSKRYDVIMYKVDNMTVEKIVGENLPMSSGSFHTAEKHLDSVRERINDRYAAMIVDHGKFKVGDVAKETDATED